MKKLYIILLPVILMVSCVDTLDDYNIDQKKATEAPPATLFTNAVKNMADVLTTPNVNINNFRLYVQHWSTTTYLDEPRYVMTVRLIPQLWWQTLYRDVLADLNESKRLVMADEFLSDEVRNNQLAQIRIIEVYAWSVLINTFGDVPYTEALNPEVSLPAYDDAASVYMSILDTLDLAIGTIDPEMAGFTEGDLLYNGDMAQWHLFGNSFKLKLGMIVADLPEFNAQTIVEEAAPNVFTGNGDNARFPYISAPPSNNPLSTELNPTYSSRQDYVMASTLVDLMNSLEDPRRQFYFTELNGEFIGGMYGFQNAYADFSHIHPNIIEEEFESLFLDYSEVEFLLAEAVERGYNVGGTAEEHYSNAIEASILYWGGSEDDATAYLGKGEVAYNSAAGDYKQKIGVQKWIALFNRGYDAWISWRRLDAPDLQPPTGEGVGDLVIPLRLIYPINEQTLNPANREAASSAIGGDDAATPLFWDVE